MIHTNTNDRDVHVLEVEHLITSLQAADKDFQALQQTLMRGLQADVRPDAGRLTGGEYQAGAFAVHRGSARDRF